MDGVVFFRCHFLVCLRSFTCHWRFLSQQTVTMNLVTLFSQHSGVLRLLDHEVAACEQTKGD